MPDGCALLAARSRITWSQNVGCADVAWKPQRRSRKGCPNL